MRIALTNAHVITGDGDAMDRGTVVVDGDRIVDVLEGAKNNGAEVVVDLEGQTLLPGLIDVHTHLVGGDKGIGYGDEATTFRMSEPLIRAVFDSAEAARVTLNAGVTTVREVAARDYIDVYLKAAQKAGQIEGPRMLVAGPGISMTGGHGAFLDPDGAADGIDGIVRRVRQLIANGVDVIKVVSADGPETLGQWWTVQTTAEEVQAAFDEARRLGRMTLAHAMGPDAIRNVVAAGATTIEHGWYLNEESCRQLIDGGTYLIPTLGNVVDIIHKGPELQMPWASMMAEDENAIFERHAMAVEMGVKIAMGSDCGGNEARVHGSNADELECFVRCGMTPSQAIVSGTLEAARAIQLDGEVGSLEPGKLADLVVVDGDPSSDIRLMKSGVVGVVQGGRVIRDDTGALDEMRRITTPALTRSSTAAMPFAAPRAADSTLVA